MVTLTAHPAADAELSAWGGDCASTPVSAPCVLTMSTPKSVAATFLRTVRLTVHVTTFGCTALEFKNETCAGPSSGNVTNVSPAIDCSGAGGLSSAKPRTKTCVYTFVANTAVSLDATTNDTFSGWGGDCGSFGNSTPCNLTLDANKTVGATFKT